MALIHSHFFSNTLGRGVSCDVILPQKSTKLIGMESAEQKRTPVLWLLHGASDDETIWQRRTSIERYAAPLGLAVVMPSVEVSGYTNLAHGGNFYDYAAKELPAVMNSFFGFSLAREDNYICGLSMGGAGALKIGLANPDFYSVIGCLSAGIFNHPLPTDTSQIDPVKNRNMFIRFDSRNLAGSEEDVVGNIAKIAASGTNIPRVYHSCGSDDFLLKAAHFTRDTFLSYEGNPFDYVYEEDPGAHTWEYWDVHIQRFLAYAFHK
ncbi:MAG: esterase family protein [Clostridia bacterium]|nr:esterase family protein [Clostridia bacterium]